VYPAGKNPIRVRGCGNTEYVIGEILNPSCRVSTGMKPCNPYPRTHILVLIIVPNLFYNAYFMASCRLNYIYSFCEVENLKGMTMCVSVSRPCVVVYDYMLILMRVHDFPDVLLFII
jgi:hypothetical protein